MTFRGSWYLLTVPKPLYVGDCGSEICVIGDLAVILRL